MTKIQRYYWNLRRKFANLKRGVARIFNLSDEAIRKIEYQQFENAVMESNERKERERKESRGGDIIRIEGVGSRNKEFLLNLIIVIMSFINSLQFLKMSENIAEVKSELIRVETQLSRDDSESKSLRGIVKSAIDKSLPYVVTGTGHFLFSKVWNKVTSYQIRTELQRESVDKIKAIETNFEQEKEQYKEQLQQFEGEKKKWQEIVGELTNDKLLLNAQLKNQNETLQSVEKLEKSVNEIRRDYENQVIQLKKEVHKLKTVNRELGQDNEDLARELRRKETLRRPYIEQRPIPVRPITPAPVRSLKNNPLPIKGMRSEERKRSETADQTSTSIQQKLWNMLKKINVSVNVFAQKKEEKEKKEEKKNTTTVIVGHHFFGGPVSVSSSDEKDANDEIHYVTKFRSSFGPAPNNEVDLGNLMGNITNPVKKIITKVQKEAKKLGFNQKIETFLKKFNQ